MARLRAYELQSAKEIGVLSKNVAAELIESAKGASTLTDEQKDLIASQLQLL